MLELVILIGSLAVTDAINPLTIAAALYLASGERPGPRVMGFAAGVFAVYTTGGIALARPGPAAGRRQR